MQRQEEGSLKGDSARGQAGGCGPWARQWEKRSWEEGQDSTRQSRKEPQHGAASSAGQQGLEPARPGTFTSSLLQAREGALCGPKAGRAWPEIGGKTLPASCTKAEAAWLPWEPRGGGGQARKEEPVAAPMHAPMHAHSWLQ